MQGRSWHGRTNSGHHIILRLCWWLIVAHAPCNLQYVFAVSQGSCVYVEDGAICNRKGGFMRRNLERMTMLMLKVLPNTSCTASKRTCKMMSSRMPSFLSRSNQNWRRHKLSSKTTLSLKVCAPKPTSHQPLKWVLRKSFHSTTRGINYTL